MMRYVNLFLSVVLCIGKPPLSFPLLCRSYPLCFEKSLKVSLSQLDLAMLLTNVATDGVWITPYSLWFPEKCLYIPHLLRVPP
jgi:hypothetical protein